MASWQVPSAEQSPWEVPSRHLRAPAAASSSPGRHLPAPSRYRKTQYSHYNMKIAPELGTHTARGCGEEGSREGPEGSRPLHVPWGARCPGSIRSVVSGRRDPVVRGRGLCALGIRWLRSGPCGECCPPPCDSERHFGIPAAAGLRGKAAIGSAAQTPLPGVDGGSVRIFS